MIHGVIFVPSFTSQVLAMVEKRNFALFNSLFVLYSKAISVFSKEIFAHNWKPKFPNQKLITK